MRIGTTFGPYVGLYWIDPIKGTLTIRPGTRGIAPEITKELTADETLGLMDGLMEPPAEKGGAGSARRSRRIARTLRAVDGGRR